MHMWRGHIVLLAPAVPGGGACAALALRTESGRSLRAVPSAAGKQNDPNPIREPTRDKTNNSYCACKRVYKRAVRTTRGAAEAAVRGRRALGHPTVRYVRKKNSTVPRQSPGVGARAPRPTQKCRCCRRRTKEESTQPTPGCRRRRGHGPAPPRGAPLGPSRRLS